MIGGTFSTIIPLLIFGGFTLFAGLLCIVLPETKGIELPNSLEEAKQLTRFGRITAFVLGLFLTLTAAIIIPWISNAETYMVMTFWFGFGCIGSYLHMFEIIMEFVEERKRVFAVTITTLGWVAGMVYSIGFAYFMRNWRILQMAAIYPFVLMLGFIGAAVSLVYFGLTMNAGNLSGDLFVEFLLSTLVEAPAYLLVLFAIDDVGRKSLHIMLMSLSGLACISSIFPVVSMKTGLQSLTVTLATIGKATVAGAFQTVYIYTPEFFPTSLRMSIMGSSAVFARTGAIAAPYIAELGKMIGGKFSTIIPLLIFGGFTLFAGLLCTVLPETKGRELPNSLEEAKQLTRSKKRIAHSPDPDEVPLKTMGAVMDSTNKTRMGNLETNGPNTAENLTVS